MSINHLQALVDMAIAEVERDDWHDRAGALRALLEGALPYLRDVLTELAKQRDADEVPA